jgi:hypothetical protein
MTSAGAPFYAIADQLVVVYGLAIAICVGVYLFRTWIRRRKSKARRNDPRRAFIKKYNEYRESLTRGGAR